KEPLNSAAGWAPQGANPSKWSQVTQTNTIYFTPTGYDTMLRVTTDGVSSYAASRSFDVQPGDEFHVSAKMRKWGGSASSGTCFVGLVFRNKAGTQVGSAYATQSAAALSTYDQWADL